MRLFRRRRHPVVIPRPARLLTNREQGLMAAVWPLVVCQHCGTFHPGLCPRIERMKYDGQTGFVTEVRYRESYTLPEGTITSEMAFGSAAEAVAAQKEQADEEERRRQPGKRQVIDINDEWAVFDQEAEASGS